MYNRYIPQQPYVPVPPPREEPAEPRRSGKWEMQPWKNLFSGLTGGWKPGKLDRGDILLLLLLAYLLAEGEEMDVPIAIGLALLMGWARELPDGGSRT